MALLNKHLLRLIPKIFGQSIFTIAEGITTVSNKVWRSGGPKRERKNDDVRIASKNWFHNELFATGEFSKDEADELTGQLFPKNFEANLGILTSLVRGFATTNHYDWPETEKIAKNLDDIDMDLLDLFQKNNFEAYKQKIIFLLEELDVRNWLTLAYENFTEVLDKAKICKSFNELIEVSTWWIIHAIFRYLACWDVEFQSKCLTDPNLRTGFSPQPLLSLLFPKLNPKSKDLGNGTYPSRGIFHLPMKQLFELSYCLGFIQRNGKWPLKMELSQRNIAGWIDNEFKNDTEQLLKKVYNGARNVTAKEFADMWFCMSKSNDSEIAPMPPWPLYVAAQIWTLLFTQNIVKNKNSKVVGVMAVNPLIYQYWWDIYLTEFKENGTYFGNMSWPNYLKNIQNI